MNAELAVSHTAAADGGLALAVIIAVAVTALLAVGMIVMIVRHVIHTTHRTVGISVVSAIAVLVGALLVGGSLAHLPTAVAGETAPKGSADAPLKTSLVELPTI